MLCRDDGSPEKWLCIQTTFVIFVLFLCSTEEVILAEERTTEEEKLHIMEGQ